MTTINSGRTTPDGQVLGRRVTSPNYLRITFKRRGEKAPWDGPSGVLLSKVERRLIETFAMDWPYNVRRFEGYGYVVDLHPDMGHTSLATFVDDAWTLALACLDMRADRDVSIRVEGFTSRPNSVFGPEMTSSLVITNS